MDPASREMHVERGSCHGQHLPGRRRLRAHRHQERRGRHWLNGRLAGGDTLLMVAIDRP